MEKSGPTFPHSTSHCCRINLLATGQALGKFFDVQSRDFSLYLSLSLSHFPPSPHFPSPTHFSTLVITEVLPRGGEGTLQMTVIYPFIENNQILISLPLFFCYDTQA